MYICNVVVAVVVVVNDVATAIIHYQYRRYSFVSVFIEITSNIRVT